jgi:hypothetical protein
VLLHLAVHHAVDLDAREGHGAGSREDDPPWFMLATDHYWIFYPLLTDEICGISHELRSLGLTVEGPVVWAGREAVRLVGVPGEEWDWE